MSGYFHRWRRDGTLEAESSLAAVYSQSVKTAEKGDRGFGSSSAAGTGATIRRTSEMRASLEFFILILIMNYL
ncbi:hypothetical protein BH11ARM2_BH11ARM2_34250 [soil metagenome]